MSPYLSALRAGHIQTEPSIRIGVSNSDLKSYLVIAGNMPCHHLHNSLSCELCGHLRWQKTQCQLPHLVGHSPHHLHCLWNTLVVERDGRCHGLASLFIFLKVVASNVALACGVQPKEQACSQSSLQSSTFPHCLLCSFSVFQVSFHLSIKQHVLTCSIFTINPPASQPPLLADCETRPQAFH